MPKRHYVAALVCYLAMPAVLIGGAALALLIDPEMARGSADYVRNYRLLDSVRTAALLAVAGLALVLWASTCYLVLRCRKRSVRWLPLAAAGPLGFTFIAMLADRSPVPGDLYQEFIGRMKLGWRIALEAVLFASAWAIAYQGVVLWRDLMISAESVRTGAPVEAIIAQQSASSGMYAFSESLETFYLVPLLYLLWPMLFNLAGRRFWRTTG